MSQRQADTQNTKSNTLRMSKRLIFRSGLHQLDLPDVSKQLHIKQSCWLLYLQQRFDMDLKYVPGPKNPADAISCYPTQPQLLRV